MQKQPNLFGMLLCLTVLFISTQAALFFVHYKVGDLVDSLAKTSIAHDMFYPVVALPILTFWVMQLAAYFLFVLWIWFISISLGELFKLSTLVTYCLGLICWVVGCAIILMLNNYFYPASFFAELLRQHVGASNAVLASALFLLLLVALLAYINVYRFKRHRLIGNIFLFLGLSVLGVASYDKFFYFQTPPFVDHAKPNIIFIGLDSMRPDYTGYFGHPTMHTPNIDKFIGSATTFTQAYTPLARTFPSWVSILTAKYPKHNHARVNLAEPEPILANDMLPKKLRAVGYQTMYGIDETFFSNVTKDYGFDQLIGPKYGAAGMLLVGLSDFPLTNLLINLPIGRFLFPYNYGNRAASITYEPDIFLKLVKRSLANRADKPLFLALHLCLAHWPFSWAGDGQPATLILPERYASSITALDAQLGKLLQILKEAGLLEHSIVVLLSDHGVTLGMPGDRLVDKKNYQGAPDKLKLVSVYKFSTAPEHSVNFSRDYSIHTSYGQGGDVLSLKQYHVLLSIKGFGVNLPVQRINDLSSLMDITPTILDMLNMSPLKQVDGLSLKPYLDQQAIINNHPRPYFIETGSSVGSIETNNIEVEKVVKQEVGVYQVNPISGLLMVNPEAEKSVIENKQQALLLGDYLLAHYPSRKQTRLIPSANNKNQLEFQVYDTEPYFVVINIKTGQWSIGLSSAFAKKAPLAALLREFTAFYGDEVVLRESLS